MAPAVDAGAAPDSRRPHQLSLAHPALAASLSAGALGDAGRLEPTSTSSTRSLRLDATSSPAAQWEIARTNTRIVQAATDMCTSVPASHSDALFRAVMTCREEVVPQIRGQLDDLLHNHLLARHR